MDYKKEIVQYVTLNLSKFNLSTLENIQVSPLGIGENNINYLIIINKKSKYVFRIPFRKESLKFLISEFKFLKTLPKHIGPKPILLDQSKKIIPRAFSILTYVEGKHIQKWTKKHLKAHAEKLAELHSDQKNYFIIDGKKYKRFNLLKQFDQELKGFEEVLDEPQVRDYLKSIRKHLAEHNFLFLELKQFSKCHLDPCVNNILIYNHKINYIDWEWSRYWDSARDVAMLFYEDFSVRPWMIKLNGERLNFYLNSYLHKRKDKTLIQRIKVWKKYLLLIDYLYFIWKLKHFDQEPNALPKKHYLQCLRVMERYLKATFLLK